MKEGWSRKRFSVKTFPQLLLLLLNIENKNGILNIVQQLGTHGHMNRHRLLLLLLNITSTLGEVGKWLMALIANWFGFGEFGPEKIQYFVEESLVEEISLQNTYKGKFAISRECKEYKNVLSCNVI